MVNRCQAIRQVLAIYHENKDKNIKIEKCETKFESGIN